jgi:hypothetical protein
MTVKDAKTYVRIIRKQNYKTNALQEKFLRGIETGKIHVHNDTLSSIQVDLLKLIYQRATR